MSVNNENFIILNSDEEDRDIEELRKLAIISMVKEEKVEHAESPLSDSELITKIHKTGQLNRRKRSSEVFEYLPKRSRSDNDDNSLSDYLDDDDENNDSSDDMTDKEKNLLKEVELKNKLLKIFNERKLNTKNEDLKIDCGSDSENDSFEIFTKLPTPSKTVMVLNEKDYPNLISNVKQTIKDVNRSIKSISSTIQLKINRFRKIDAEIEKLKRQKVEIHKEINVSRAKIVNLNKIKKQKSIDLIKYEKELAAKQKLAIKIDCNQIICSDWLNATCSKTNCVYQHPKVNSYPSKIKQNPNRTVFREPQTAGLVTKLRCDSCLDMVSIPTIHLNDDWYCKSCCQRLMHLSESEDIIRQLISIWHHIYKRYISVRNPSYFLNLYKCADAMIAILSTSIDRSSPIFNSAGRHVISTLIEDCQIERLMNFIRLVNYHPELVLYAVDFPFPGREMHRILIDSINHQLTIIDETTNIGNHIELLIDKFYRLSKNLQLPVSDQLIDWLKVSVGNIDNLSNEKGNIETNRWGNLINCLTRLALDHVFDQSQSLVMSNCLSLAALEMELELDDQYWIDRRDRLFTVVHIFKQPEELEDFDLPFHPWIDQLIHLSIVKLIILTSFFSGDEEQALELCDRYSNQNDYFRILLSRLCLNCNHSPVPSSSKVLTINLFIEHSYNKSYWLSHNRSINSCVSLLESIPRSVLVKLGLSSPQLKHFQFIDHRDQYRSLLGLDFCSHINQLANWATICQNSATWLCYINLLVFRVTQHPSNSTSLSELEQLLQSEYLSNCLSIEHLTRVACALSIQFSKLCNSNLYSYRLRLIWRLLSEGKTIDFVHFIDFFQSINFSNLQTNQLDMWLLLIDQCTFRYSDHALDSFLLLVSSKLSSKDYLDNDSTQAANYDVFRHIVTCYPIRLADIWLNYIQLQLDIKMPIYQLIDSCRTAVNQFCCSRQLWRHYYSFAVRSEDKDLEKTVKENAAKYHIKL